MILHRKTLAGLRIIDCRIAFASDVNWLVDRPWGGLIDLRRNTLDVEELFEPKYHGATVRLLFRNEVRFAELWLFSPGLLYLTVFSAHFHFLSLFVSFFLYVLRISCGGFHLRSALALMAWVHKQVRTNRHRMSKESQPDLNKYKRGKYTAKIWIEMRQEMTRMREATNNLTR